MEIIPFPVFLPPRRPPPLTHLIEIRDPSSLSGDVVSVSLSRFPLNSCRMALWSSVRTDLSAIG